MLVSDNGRCSILWLQAGAAEAQGVKCTKLVSEMSSLLAGVGSASFLNFSQDSALSGGWRFAHMLLYQTRPLDVRLLGLSMEGTNVPSGCVCDAGYAA